MAHSGKLFALGLLGVAVALVWLSGASTFEVGEEAAVDSGEDDLADTDFVYRSRTLKAAKAKSSETTESSLLDDPVGEAPVKDCLNRCSRNIRSNCPEFFAGTPWPPSSYGDSSASRACRICQTQEDGDVVFFATLYNPYYRIPEYTATAITRNPKAKANKRDNSLWKRIQLGMCSDEYINEFPKSTKKAGVRKISGRDSSDVMTKLEKACGDCQALCEDLNGCDLDKGHINPSHINDKEKDKQDATFSMINMAPQASNFNRAHSRWEGIESQITKKAEEIFEKAKDNKILYVITGTKTFNTLFVNVLDYINVEKFIPLFEPDDWVKGRVLFPRYFWMAVCYTGDKKSGLKAFGYGYYGLNRDDVKENITKLSMPEFDNWLYGGFFGSGKHIFEGSSVCTAKNLRKRDEL